VFFVDYTKAFDHVDHTILLSKLVDLGTPKYLTKWVYSFLKDHGQRVKIDLIPYLNVCLFSLLPNFS